MTTEASNNLNEKDKHLNLEYLLRTNGYLFPETVDEVNEYQRKFGDTDIILPSDMKTPTFLEKGLKRFKENHLKVVKDVQENFAVAARMESGAELPEHITKRMENDRNKIK